MVTYTLTPNQMDAILRNITPTISAFKLPTAKYLLRLDKQKACNSVAAGSSRLQYFPSLTGHGTDTNSYTSIGYSELGFAAGDIIKISYSTENRTRYQNGGSTMTAPLCYTHTVTATQSADLQGSGGFYEFVVPHQEDVDYLTNYLSTVIADPTKINLSTPVDRFFSKYYRSSCIPRTYLNDLSQHKQPFGPSKLFK